MVVLRRFLKGDQVENGPPGTLILQLFLKAWELALCPQGLGLT